MISIHAPARGATSIALFAMPLRIISIHAPARGATSGDSAQINSTGISIHAPARGATSKFTLVLPFLIFQSTLPRGERQEELFAETRLKLFQSTLPRGERLFVRFRFSDVSEISIHAPARGATDHAISALRYAYISIHAPARGATSILSKIHPMFLTISHNASSFSSFPFHSFLPHLLNSSTFCALFQVRISRAFSVYYRFAPKKSTPDL